jgi:signal peptidase II
MIDAARRHLLFWSVAVAGAAVDLAAKSLIFGWLGFDWATRKPDPPLQVIDGFFSLETALNTGTFFGQLANRNSPLIIFTVLMMALVIIMFLAPPREVAGSGWGRLYTTALALVLAGAAGNLWDRVACDAVRDFLVFRVCGFPWPTFNLADVWLTLGIGLYLLATWRAARREKQEEGAGTPGQPGKTAANDQAG